MFHACGNIFRPSWYAETSAADNVTRILEQYILNVPKLWAHFLGDKVDCSINIVTFRKAQQTML